MSNKSTETGRSRGKTEIKNIDENKTQPERIINQARKVERKRDRKKGEEPHLADDMYNANLGL